MHSKFKNILHALLQEFINWVTLLNMPDHKHIFYWGYIFPLAVDKGVFAQAV